MTDRYDYVGDFSQGVAIVVKDDLYGVILMGGNEIIAPSYDYISPFKDGYAQAIRKGECKILDLSGRECKHYEGKLIAIPAKYDSVRDFKNGYACVQLNGKWGAIDVNCNEIYEPQFYFLSDFIGGTAKYKTECKQYANSWGFLNTDGFRSECNLMEPVIESDGNLIIERYELSTNTNGSVYVNMANNNPNRRVRINNKGQLLVKNGESLVALPEDFLLARNFENGLAIVQDSTGYWGAVDVNGRIVIALQYTCIKNFSENKAFAINKNGRLCLISTNGTIIKEFATYSDGDSFRGGYAIVSADGKHGLINGNGKEILSPLDGYIHYTKNLNEFEITSSFFGGKRGLFITTTGLLVKPKYNKIVEVKKDCVVVEVDQIGECLIDLLGCVFVEKDGKRITFPDWCIGVKFLRENLFLGRSDNGKWGLLDGTGETLCEPTFDNIGEIDNDMIPLIKKETITVGGWRKETKEITKYGLYNVNSKVLIPVDYDVCPECTNGYYKITSKGLLGVINEEGVVILNPEWKQIHLSNGYYVVSKIIEEEYSENERFGLTNLNGDLILETKYKAISVLRDGLYKVRENSTWSIFNDEGRITKETYDEIDIEGNFIIVSKNGLSGRLNEHAEKVIKSEEGNYLILPSKFAWGYDFKDGIAKVLINGCENFINKSFDIVVISENQIIPIDKSIDHLVSKDKNGNYVFVQDKKYGIINHSGKTIIEAKYQYLSHLADKLYIAGITKEGDHGNSYGIIDIEDKTILAFEYSTIKQYGGKIPRSYWSWDDEYVTEQVEIPEEVHHWYIKKNGYGLIDRNGDVCIRPIYEDIQRIDRCFLIKENNKYGIISSDYNLVCNPKYSAVSSIGNGFWKVSIITSQAYNNKSEVFGILDSEGKERLEPIYQFIGNVNDERVNKGRAIINLKGQLGLVDENYCILAEPQYEHISEFKNGYATVNNGHWYDEEDDDYPHRSSREYSMGKWGVINTNGQLILSPIYDSINIEDSCFSVSKNILVQQHNGTPSYKQVFGRYNKDGELIVKNVHGEYIIASKKYDWQEDFNTEGQSKAYYKENIGIVNEKFQQIVSCCIEGKTLEFALSEEYDWGYNSLSQFVIVEKNNKKGVIDCTNKTIIEPVYDQIIVFDGSTNTVFKCGIQNKKHNSFRPSYTWSIINVDGKPVIDIQSEEIIHLGFSLLAIQRNNKYSIVDFNGQSTSEASFDTVFCFGVISSVPTRYSWETPKKVDGLNYAIVNIDGKFGVIDNQGRLTIEPKYSSLSIHNNNQFLADGMLINAFEQKIVVKNNSVLIISEDYDKIERLENGILLVSKNKLYGCINQIGAVIIPLKYKSLTYQNNLLIAVCYDETDKTYKYGVIDFKEKEIVPFSQQIDEIKIETEIILYKQDWHWGAYSLQGQVICEPIYDHIVYVANNLIKVGMDGTDYEPYEDCYWEDGERYDFTNYSEYSIINWGLIDDNGKEILPLEYRAIADKVIDGLVEVRSNKRIGYVDITGRILLEPTYKSISEFVDGYAVVSKASYYYDENGRDRERSVYGVINSQFKEIIPCIFSSIEYEEKSGRFKTDVGYKTLDGRYVAEVDGKELLLDKKYKYCKSFSDTCAIAVRISGGHVKYGLVDKRSNDILPPIFSRLDCVENELYKFKINDLYGLVNSKGNIILQNVYNGIGKFEDDLACVQVNVPSGDRYEQKKLYGYVDSLGNEILPPSYEFIGKRNNKYAVVMKNNLWGLFSIESHRLSIVPNAAFLGPCMDDLCKINVGGVYDKNNKKTTGGLWGYVSVDGQIIIEPTYEQAYGFSEGMAAVKLNGKWGFINSEGIIVVPCEYDEVEASFENGKGKLVKDGEIYVFNQKGSQIDTYDQSRDDDDYYDGGYDDTPSIYDNPYYNDNLDMDQQSIEFWNSL